MSNTRIWLFRGLVVGATGLVVASFFLPWWKASIPLMKLDPALLMHPYGLEHFLDQSLLPYFEKYIPPFWLTIVAFIFIVVDAIAILLSISIGGRRGKLILGGAGLAYLGFSAIAMIFAAISVSNAGLSFLGRSPITFVFHAPSMIGTLQYGLFIALGAGLLCIILALLRDRIIGKPKISA